MSAIAQLIAVGKPSPSLTPSSTPSSATKLRFGSFLSVGPARGSRALDVDRPIFCNGLRPGLRPGPVCRKSLGKRSLFSCAASTDEPEPVEINVEVEKGSLKTDEEKTQDVWERSLGYIREQAIKMRNLSPEAYDEYSKKAISILKETSEKIEAQSKKARSDLSMIAKEISKESKEYFAKASENSPEPVKDIVETFASSTNELNDASKIRDFHLGIPYGALLSVTGFLYFMLTGSINAIRFGVILGGTLLALSISNLRCWRKGESTSLALRGETAIATILFLRELRLLFQSGFYVNFFTTLISGCMAAFFASRMLISDDEQIKGAEN
ncbi:unnamed protein product [Cuscuta epithymum]|uniref:Protein FATTY ACID EXPORT 3, chloroplastic n=1 Tax=Cuscuta epithymum TaxID=186058 RepID=A0AAV0FGE2_9ASTE|nr:unnamed protein product [Cuscuta epithymum]